QVIIDKNPRITTVVNKVVVKESGCSFRFDFAKVYWNSRLQNGHRVFANDLNPDSYSALRGNGARNKIKPGLLTTGNDCGRAFARKLIRERQVFHHAILNLPDSALTFLDTFRGVRWREHGFDSPPVVHVYCFSKAVDPKQARKFFLLLLCWFGGESLDALDRANEVMGSSLTQREVKIHVVRDVAPNKPMLCLSFLAPDAGADGKTEGTGTEEEAAKGGGDAEESSPGGDVGDAAPAAAEKVAA
ncbi:unnamed protein product, partial [Ectocarpus sp. 12 AP-2014]